MTRAPNKSIKPKQEAKNMKRIELPCYGIVVHVDEKNPQNGRITSNLKEEPPKRENVEDMVEREKFDAAYDMVTAIVLAHACAGVNIESPAYIEGIESAIEGAGNQL